MIKNAFLNDQQSIINDLVSEIVGQRYEFNKVMFNKDELIYASASKLEL